jgi:hypothetical protein
MGSVKRILLPNKEVIVRLLILENKMGGVVRYVPLLVTLRKGIKDKIKVTVYPYIPGLWEGDRIEKVFFPRYYLCSLGASVWFEVGGVWPDQIDLGIEEEYTEAKGAKSYVRNTAEFFARKKGFLGEINKFIIKIKKSENIGAELDLQLKNNFMISDFGYARDYFSIEKKIWIEELLKIYGSNILDFTSENLNKLEIAGLRQLQYLLDISEIGSQIGTEAFPLLGISYYKIPVPLNFEANIIYENLEGYEELLKKFPDKKALFFQEYKKVCRGESCKTEELVGCFDRCYGYMGFFTGVSDTSYLYDRYYVIGALFYIDDEIAKGKKYLNIAGKILKKNSIGVKLGLEQLCYLKVLA